MKWWLKERCLKLVEEIQEEMQEVCNALAFENFQKCIELCEKHWNHWIHIQGDYLFKRRQWKLKVTISNYFFMVRFPNLLGCTLYLVVKLLSLIVRSKIQFVKGWSCVGMLLSIYDNQSKLQEMMGQTVLHDAICNISQYLNRNIVNLYLGFQKKLDDQLRNSPAKESGQLFTLLHMAEKISLPKNIKI